MIGLGLLLQLHVDITVKLCLVGYLELINLLTYFLQTLFFEHDLCVNDGLDVDALETQVLVLLSQLKQLVVLVLLVELEALLYVRFQNRLY